MRRLLSLLAVATSTVVFFGEQFDKLPELGVKPGYVTTILLVAGIITRLSETLLPMFSPEEKALGAHQAFIGLPFGNFSVALAVLSGIAEFLLGIPGVSHLLAFASVLFGAVAGRSISLGDQDDDDFIGGDPDYGWVVPSPETPNDEVPFDDAQSVKQGGLGGYGDH